VPGETYIISLQDSNTNVFLWKYAGDTYSGGTALFANLPQAESDYFFRVNP
jgi:hypothetical protein